jgi:hypothetical protein
VGVAVPLTFLLLPRRASDERREARGTMVGLWGTGLMALMEVDG